MVGKDYRKVDEWTSATHHYVKLEQSENYMVWELHRKQDDGIDAWEVWAPKDGRWRKPKIEEYGTTGFYCLDRKDIAFWKRVLTKKL